MRAVEELTPISFRPRAKPRLSKRELHVGETISGCLRTASNGFGFLRRGDEKVSGRPPPIQVCRQRQRRFAHLPLKDAVPSRRTSSVAPSDRRSPDRRYR